MQQKAEKTLRLGSAFGDGIDLQSPILFGCQANVAEERNFEVGLKDQNRKWNLLSILVTGGTGSFGNQFVETVMAKYHPRRLIVFSRDELKQFEMRQRFPDGSGSSMRYFVGDVRDLDRLKRAMEGVDIVVHAAALKQVPSCEYNPFEAVKTNIYGAQNVIEAAIATGVKKVVALSTDKAVNPINLYGATKLCAEKIFIQGNAYARQKGPRFSCVRYGNVIGSRGSVIPLFREQRKSGKITITDPRMTRFWITLPDAVEMVLKAIRHMQGGEIFVPKLPSMKVIDLAKAIAPECEIECIGIRPGEKIHEALITEEEGRHTVSYDGMYVIMPHLSWWKRANYKNGKRLADGFFYNSHKNKQWLTIQDLKEMLQNSWPVGKNPADRFLAVLHNLNEKVVLNLINSEERLQENGNVQGV
jgi:UDP-N-acetylglucosamine 4,6-dehydratase